MLPRLQWSVLLVGGRLQELAHEWSGIGPLTLEMVQGLLLHSNQKASLVKQSHKHEVKIPKAQDTTMSSEIDRMLSDETIELCPGKGSLPTLSLFPREMV